MRGALAAGAVVAAVSFTPAPALADTPSATPSTPAAPTSTDPVTEYRQLSQQADALNEKMDTANVELAKEQQRAQQASADIAKAKAAEAVAQAAENQYLDQVDQLTDASFEGARLTQLSALLTGTSARDFLNRATDLQYLASDSYDTLSKFSDAVNAAKAAENRAQHDLQAAQDATAAAHALQTQLTQQGQQLQTQFNQLLSDKAQFTPSELAQLDSQGVGGVFIGPPGIRGAAMQIALNQRGKPYVWAAAGPGSFDCSGLVIYAYALAGMPGLPHSSQVLSTMGEPVSRADLQAGDLVFFGFPVHHVGIYVGDGLMVNAPDFGEPVRVQPLDSDFEGGRRLG
jgi:cell wall-associated NlpC family hydrolase